MNTPEKHNEDFFNSKSIKHGFSIPKGYFDSVEDTFSSKLFEETLPEDTGLQVPSNYFDTVENNILSKVEFPKRGKVVSLRKNLTRIIPAAAAACIGLFLTLNVIFGETIVTEPTSDEIAAWFDENISSISNDDLTAIFDADDLVDSSILENIVDSEEIDTYINENDTNLFIDDSTILLDEIN